MKDFFHVDGKFFAVMSKIVDLFLVVIMWALGCLPVVTIITSTASMYTTVVKCIRYDRGRVLPEFWEAYKTNLRQGIGLTLLYGCVGAVIGYLDYWVFFLSTSRTGAVLILAVVMLGLSAVYLLNLLWIVPVFSRFSNTLGNILKLNYVIAVRSILRSIPMLFALVCTGVLLLAVNELVFILPAAVVLFLSFLVEPALWRYMPKQEEDNGDWRYGFH